MGRVRCFQPAIVRDLTTHKRICHKCTSRPSEPSSCRLRRLRCMAGFIRGSAALSPLRTTAVGSRGGQKTGLCRRRIRRSNLRPRTGFGSRLHSCQHGPPLLGNLPATVAPFDHTFFRRFRARACMPPAWWCAPTTVTRMTTSRSRSDRLAKPSDNTFRTVTWRFTVSLRGYAGGQSAHPVQIAACPVSLQASCRAEARLQIRSCRLGVHRNPTRICEA